ncbi:MAG: hypothetical protein UH071_04660 [Paludibacteraceae bacterium]|nr:hypothetical protein [Paludibacteraceae bacterium]
MIDEILGTLEFQENTESWVGCFDTPALNSDGNLLFALQDNNKEGILDVQRDAYKTYLQNEEKYKSSVTELLLDYYKWNYEFIARTVSDLDENDHKDVVTENQLYQMIDLWCLFICRDGSFGYTFGCCWDDENDLAVLLSESKPRVISRTQLENLHKLNDPTLGLLVHDGKNAWKGLEVNSFFGKKENLEIELEGGVDEKITVVQQKAYEKYLNNKDDYFREFTKMMITVYIGDEEKASDMVMTQGNIKVTVETALPKTLFIDREGNFGWKVYTQWNDSYIGVLLSDDKPYIMTCDKLRNYANEEKVKDEVLGIVFPSLMGFENIVIVRLVDNVYTLPLVISTYQKEITDNTRQSFMTFLKMRGTFWSNMRDRMLEYYLYIYDDLEENFNIPEQFNKENVSKRNILKMVRFTKLFISTRSRIAWLCESPTDEEDGLAFEFSNGEIKLISQSKII